jgi:hypothetical protein
MRLMRPPLLRGDAFITGLGFILLLGACASGAGYRGAPGTYAQVALDTETNTCLRFPANCPGMADDEVAAWIARKRLAELGASVGAAIEGLRILEAAQRALIDKAIVECVVDADFKVNEKWFKGNPTRQQCQEIVEQGARGEPVTRAMLLGREKHHLAMECIQAKLSELRPRGFKLNQRYRFDERTGRWEPVSDAEVAALLRAGGQGLIGTLVPDVVIHTGSLLEILEVYDLKFPCPGTNNADWYAYPQGHLYQGQTQGQMYQQAFGGDPARVAPRWGVIRVIQGVKKP